MGDYRETALNIYGDKCEFCGATIVEVHHIDYQEHQQMENQIRAYVRQGKDITLLLEEARFKGYQYWNNNQLSKDDRSMNLAVLCPNHHTWIHRMDVGMKLLGALNRRI